jgi:hypothetical protein
MRGIWIDYAKLALAPKVFGEFSGKMRVRI